MAGFLGGWRNNDSLFGVIWYLSGENGDVAKRVSLACLGLLVSIACLWRAPLERVVLGFIAGMLLISANVHPWYMAWMAPLLAIEPAAGGASLGRPDANGLRGARQLPRNRNLAWLDRLALVDLCAGLHCVFGRSGIAA